MVPFPPSPPLLRLPGVSKQWVVLVLLLRALRFSHFCHPATDPLCSVWSAFAGSLCALFSVQTLGSRRKNLIVKTGAWPVVFFASQPTGYASECLSSASAALASGTSCPSKPPCWELAGWLFFASAFSGLMLVASAFSGLCALRLCLFRLGCWAAWLQLPFLRSLLFHFDSFLPFQAYWLGLAAIAGFFYLGFSLGLLAPQAQSLVLFFRRHGNCLLYKAYLMCFLFLVVFYVNGSC